MLKIFLSDKGLFSEWSPKQPEPFLLRMLERGQHVIHMLCTAITSGMRSLGATMSGFQLQLIMSNVWQADDAQLHLQAAAERMHVDVNTATVTQWNMKVGNAVEKCLHMMTSKVFH